MTELEKYQLVNKCETFDDLVAAIRKIANDEGDETKLHGNSKSLNVEKMVFACKVFVPEINHRNLTRKYGIRQQAMYIYFYEKRLNDLKKMLFGN